MKKQPQKHVPFEPNKVAFAVASVATLVLLLLAILAITASS